MSTNSSYHECNPHKLVTSDESKMKIEIEEQQQKKSRRRRSKEWYLGMALPWLALILTILVVVGFNLYPDFHLFNGPATIERLTFGLALAGTLLGAVGASRPASTCIKYRRRDKFALWGWAALAVGALIAFLNS